jgi:hypothetical protein
MGKLAMAAAITAAFVPVTNVSGDQVAPDPTASCGPTPANVQFIAPMNWGEANPRIRIELQNQIKSSPFTTTSNPGYYGQVGAAELTGGSYIVKRIWISRCPGGEVLEPDFRCGDAATEVATVGWTQSDHRGKCQLKPNTRYFMNFAAENCNGGTACGLNRSFKRSDTP